jgi:ubiquinone/menaquinone biosynthesis C-methylase UbiE
MSYAYNILHQEKLVMQKRKPKNTYSFDEDIKSCGQYRYTDFNKYSAYIATRKQSEEIIKLLKERFSKDIRILDVGCGDGVFTFELLKRVSPKKIIAFDCAKEAIRVANNAINKKKDKGKIKFLTGSAYDAHKMFKKNSFDVIVIRGVLHHLSDPERAIKSLRCLSGNIIVLEPNGYNPILKIIENISPYHSQHGEKSYWPPTLNKWFMNNSFKVKKQLFFSIVPYFCPENIVKMLKFIEPFMEKIPYIKQFYCGTNLIFYEKQ